MPDSKRENPSLTAELEAMFAEATLPTSPALATQILSLIDDPHATAAQFARLIEADPALSARLLRMANSARYGQRHEVTTITRAVTVIGLRQLRVVALGFELVRHLDSLGGCAFDLPEFWQQSILRACLAREVARAVVPALAEEAFLAGLLQDCGILLLVQTLGDEYAAMCAEQVRSPTAFFEAEQHRFPYTHVDAAVAMTSMWDLPEAIAGPIAGHHAPVTLAADADDIDRLGAVCYFVGSMGFDERAEIAATEPALQAYARTTLGLEPDRLERILEDAGEAYGQVAGLFEGTVSEAPDVADLMLTANRLLIRHAAESEARASDMEAERDQIIDEQKTLRTALGQYREQAARDPLTGLLNRRALHNAGLDCLRRADRATQPVTVLFLDLDNFKWINDRHGHPAGDEVLRAVATSVREAVTDGGCAGRYGGEEFVVVIPHVSAEEARERAEGLVRAVRDGRVLHDGHEIRVTCSVGAVWCDRPESRAFEELLGAADELMYIAKRGGKDRTCFRALPLHGLTTTVDVQTIPGDATAAPLAFPDDHAEETSLDEYTRVAKLVERDDPSWFADGRKLDRRRVFAPCSVSFCVDGTMRVEQVEAFVRNVSAGGVGLLASRRLVRGDLVEVCLEIDGGTSYLVGLVAFCRHVEGTIHEVGVQVFQRADRTMLGRDPAALVRELEWIKRVPGDDRPGETDVRQSA
ncbi:MAG: HDOD domain-containing protein [Planctomycetota bacterium]|jgi:diguanylate cyclase (GGDEF)-like protein